jgi:hypothetical protein
MADHTICAIVIFVLILLLIYYNSSEHAISAPSMQQMMQQQEQQTIQQANQRAIQQANARMIFTTNSNVTKPVVKAATAVPQSSSNQSQSVGRASQGTNQGASYNMNELTGLTGTEYFY